MFIADARSKSEQIEKSTIAHGQEEEEEEEEQFSFPKIVDGLSFDYLNLGSNHFS